MTSQTPTPEPNTQNLLTRITWLILATAFLLCTIRVIYLDRQISAPTGEVIRIAHWQLEAGYRGSVDQAIKRYEALNPGVKVIQLGITEKVYGQWLNTHLLAGTAPDIFELGKSKVLSNDTYLPRFLLPLSDAAAKPNPHNKGTAAQDLRWRDTFRDGMRSGLHAVTQEYYSAPTALFTARIFINTDILKQATGSTEPPKTLAQLIDAAEKMRALKTSEGQPVLPIAGGAECATLFIGGYLVPFTANYESLLDLDLDGIVTPREAFTGWATGKISFDTPGLADYYHSLRAITTYFAPGFMAMGRDQALFLFVQGRAGMIAAGSYESAGLTRNVPFPVTIISFPLPAKGEPFSRAIAGKANEASLSGGSPMGINRASRYPARALDFLQFLTSVEGNEILNAGSNWVPVVTDSKPTPEAIPFLPGTAGYTAKVDIKYGVVPSSIWTGQLWRYLQGEIPDTDFFKAINDALADPRYGGKNAWAMDYADQKQWVRQQERTISAYALQDLLEPASPQKTRRLNALILEQQRTNNAEDLRARYQDAFNEPIGQP
jgi:raffinose/stachyose/melibiose transport system substrate-binding protein